MQKFELLSAGCSFLRIYLLRRSLGGKETSSKLKVCRHQLPAIALRPAFLFITGCGTISVGKVCAVSKLCDEPK